MITQERLYEITSRIVSNYQPQKVVLFGSYAKGKATQGSDLDLLIVKETATPRYKRGREVRKSLRGLKTSIDLLVYTPDEIERWRHVKNAFITTILRTGKVLYERKA
ncbi:nucleotidyltransferase domain-containing protein [candidate division KSB1 bacterium]|nr:nucleotidyltransferase domain-containing protein [candidate division KSB1 bacterium]